MPPLIPGLHPPQGASVRFCFPSAMGAVTVRSFRSCLAIIPVHSRFPRARRCLSPVAQASPAAASCANFRSTASRCVRPHARPQRARDWRIWRSSGASEQEGFKRFVHVSSVGVHGHVERPPASETAPFAAGDVYQATKLEGEQWLAAYAKETGLPAVVVRPAAIYGPGDCSRCSSWPPTGSCP